MKNATKIATGIAALYLVGLMAVAPIAGAQGEATINVNVKDVKVSNLGSAGRLAPETSTATVKADFSLSMPNPSGCVGKIVQLKYTVVGQPTYATVTLAPTTESKPWQGGSSGQPNEAYTSTAVFTWEGWSSTATVAFSRQAPAFVDVPIKIKAELSIPGGTSSGCTTTGSGQSAEAQSIIKADYLPSIQVLPDAIIQTSGQNKKVLFPINVINFGNGPTRVASETLERTKGLNAVVPPAELFLESKATSGEKAQNTAQVFVTVLTPNKNGYTNKVYSFDTIFKARSDTQGQDLLTQELSVPLSVKVQGVYVPGFDSVSMIAGLGIAMIGLGAMRRRQG